MDFILFAAAVRQAVLAFIGHSDDLAAGILVGNKGQHTAAGVEQQRTLAACHGSIRRPISYFIGLIRRLDGVG